MLLVVEQRLLQ